MIAFGKEIGRRPAEGALRFGRYHGDAGMYFELYDEVTYETVVKGVHHVWSRLEPRALVHTGLQALGYDAWMRHIRPREQALRALEALLVLPSLLAKEMAADPEMPGSTRTKKET